MMEYLSLMMLCPSRNRYEMAVTLAASVINTRGCTMTEIRFVVDSFREKAEYSASSPFVNGRVWQSQMPTISLAWTDVAFHENCYDLYRMTNDDEVCRTPGWDKRVLEVANEYPDGIFALYVDDGFKGAAHCAFPIVSRKWIDTLGYFAPPYFEFGYNDTWIMDLAQRVGRLRHIPDVTIDHMHFTREGGYPRDATTDRVRMGGQGKRDRERYDLLEPIRALDAEKLRKVMQ